MIRIATLEDIPSLSLLMIKLLNHHQVFDDLYKVDSEHHHSIDLFFADILAQDHIHVYVAEIELEIAGYIICSKHERPPFFEIKSKGRIDSLFVDSNYRNQNLASLLVNEALNFLVDEPYIELEFTAQNQLAEKFWLSKGFNILNHQCILSK